MDYSVILGIHHKRSDQLFIKKVDYEFSSMESADKKEVYYIGIIDYLQKWNLKKKAERTVKAINSDKV